MNLPPINQIGMIGQGGLPPINQIPGYSVPGQPAPNPGQQMNGFFVDPATGQGIGVANAGEAVYQAPQGNPLYYGQTGAYTGPNGPTDGANGAPGLPPVDKVAAGTPLTYEDALTFMYGDMLGRDYTEMSGGPQQQAYFVNALLGGDQNRNDMATRDNLLNGLDMGAAYDPSAEAWQTLLGRLNANVRSGGGQ